MARIFRRNIFTGEFEDVDVSFEDLRIEPSAPRRCGVPRTYQEHKPLESITLACHPRQAKEFNEIVKRQGRAASVHYRESDGMCEITSRQARAEECKARQKFDGDAGYGDWAGS